MPRPFIQVKRLTKEFTAGRPVIRGISFDFSEGDSLGILGRSGGGKSVLLHTIRGTEGFEPTEGEVIFHLAKCPRCLWVDLPRREGERCPKCGGTFNLEEVDYWGELKDGSDLSRIIFERIGVFLQHTFALYGDLTSLENIFETMRGEGVVDKAGAYRLLSKVGLGHRVSHLARDLSGGEKQRVILAMQLAKKPMLLLADEPTGTLDPLTSKIVHSVLVEERGRGFSMMVTSHRPKVVEELCGEALLLDEGTISVKGPPSKVVEIFLNGYREVEVPTVEVGAPIVIMKNCAKVYYTAFPTTEVKALDGVDLTINEGEIFGILGLSGAGKTTLARIVAGYLPPSEGDVLVRVGERWFDMKEPGAEGRSLPLQLLSILPQEYALYPYRTVYDNLTSAIGLMLPEEISQIKVKELLASLGFSEKRIEEMQEMHPDDLSVGERQRVAIARALMKEPRITILDEPTGTLDVLTTMEVAASIKKAREELQQTFLIVSHDTNLIEYACDKAALMRGGKVVMVGDPKEVVATFKRMDEAAPSPSPKR